MPASSVTSWSGSAPSRRREGVRPDDEVDGVREVHRRVPATPQVGGGRAA